MNLSPTDFIRVRPDRLREFTRAAFAKVGMNANHAATLADLLVTNDLRGVWSHGTRYQIPNYTRQFRNGELNPNPEVKVVAESPTILTVDGDGGLGYFPSMRAANELITKAKSQGVAVATTRNHGHFGAAGIYSRILVKANLIAWITSGHQLNLTPEQDLFAAAGGSPHSFGVPVAGDDPDLVLDFGAIHDMYPGQPHRMTLVEIAPGTVFRSIGLGVICQTLGGLLCGVPADPARANRKWSGANQGACMVAIDPTRFMPRDDFAREMQEYVARARQLQPLPGFEPAELPGQPEARREREYARDGIPVGPEHQAALRTVAEELQLTPPF